MKHTQNILQREWAEWGGGRDTPMYVLLLLLALLVSTLTGLFLVLCVTLKIELRDSVNETETVTKNLNRE